MSELKTDSVDTIIRIDRTIRPAYPRWVQKIMHPELENTGPAEFALAKIELWQHPAEKERMYCIRGVYEYLKENDMFKTCLSLRDGEEIKKKGFNVFRKFFGGITAYLWKSVVRNSHGVLFVPYLCSNDGWVVLDWARVDHDRYSLGFALRFTNDS